LLEDLRFLTNYAMDSENRLALLHVGHPELRRRMSMAALDALAVRRVVVLALDPSGERCIASSEVKNALQPRAAGAA
jgi:type II secretory pathway predicted ATPase ExeA